MSCNLITRFSHYYNQEIRIKVIKMQNDQTPWFELSGVANGLHYSKSENALLQYVEPWAAASLEEICKNNNCSVKSFNKLTGENFPPNKVFLNKDGIYQIMIGKTNSPVNFVKNFLIKEVLKPEITLDEEIITSTSDLKHEETTPTEENTLPVGFSWHFELKIPYECDQNLIICDKHGTKFRLSLF